jgi:hypothetical protein
MQQGEIGELTGRGTAAAVRLAQRLGLPHHEPLILSNRGNLLVHLAPAPVVARVATLTARSRRDPVAWLAREVAVAGYVASHDGPVVAPAEEAGPHWQDGSLRPTVRSRGLSRLRLNAVAGSWNTEVIL